LLDFIIILDDKAIIKLGNTKEGDGVRSCTNAPLLLTYAPWLDQ